MIFANNINFGEAKEAIKNRKEFKITFTREGLAFIKYTFCKHDTFPALIDKEAQNRSTQILYECRGIAFNIHTGKCVSRRFHKFFNINEKQHTKESNLDLKTKKFRLFEKVDGSLVAPVVIPDNIPSELIDPIRKKLNKKDKKDVIPPNTIKWATMAGYNSDQNAEIEKYIENVKDTIKYEQLARDCLSKGITPLLEYCSSKRAIVIRHDSTMIKLIGGRYIESGDYVDYETLLEWGKHYNIPVMKDYTSMNTKDTALIDHIKQLPDIEGVVVVFEDDSRLKVKTDFYSCVHNLSLKNWAFEKQLLRSICAGVFDDVISYSSNLDRHEEILKKWAIEVEDALEETIDRLENDKGIESPIYQQYILFCQENYPHSSIRETLPKFVVEVSRKFGFDDKKKELYSFLNLKPLPHIEGQPTSVKKKRRAKK